MASTTKNRRKGTDKITEEYTNGQCSKVSVEHAPRKTAWDWAQLLIVPILLAGLGFWFTAQQNQIAAQASKNQHDADTQMALEQQRQQSFVTYQQDISDLILKDNLRSSKAGDEVRTVARIQTLSVMRILDPNRKGLLIRFLYEAQLITGQYPTISLKGADLTDMSLHWANLNDVNFSEAFLSRSDLNHTVLIHAFLDHASFVEADFRGANFSGASLARTDLRNTDLRGAVMNGVTDLNGIRLQGAKYNRNITTTRDEQGNPMTLNPTQWPQEFDPEAAGAICID